MKTFFTTGPFIRSKHLVILLAVLFIIIGFLLLVTIRNVQSLHLTSSPVPENLNHIDDPLWHASAPRKPPTPGVGPVVGKASAPVTVVEFTDYECPLCRRYFEEAYTQIRKQYIVPGLVKYEIRNYPLSSIHRNADVAAEAALCAAKQNAFEKMHDLLFANQAEWSGAADPTVFFRSYAATIDISVAAFSGCLNSHELWSGIERDRADAGEAGINGTPSFWIYGPDGSVRQINGAYPFATYQAAFDTFLQSVQQ